MSSAARAPRQWALIVVLVASVAINYIDRSNLSVAAPLLKSEMGISVAQLGFLLSAFFWTYAVFQLVSGWLVDRFSVNLVMTAGFVIWTGATAATALVGTFSTLFVMRLLLGMGESVAYPCYAKILTAGTDERRRGLANAFIDAGSKSGPAVATFVGGMVIARFGWRPLFLGLGLLCLLWLPAWWKWRPKGIAAADTAGSVAEDAAPATRRPSVMDILLHRSAWPTFVGHFCGNYFWYFLLTWLPFYLVNSRHFSLREMALAGSLPPLCAAITTLIAGTVSYHVLARGVSLTRVRKTCTGGGLLVATLVAFVPAIPDNRLSMLVMIVASAGYGVFASSHWTITHTIAGPLAAGRWSGMQNFVANLSGVAAPALSGLAIAATGTPLWAFVLVAATTLTGSATYLFGLPKVAPAVWEAAEPITG